MASFKVFLSHRYKSPQTNLFFFELFARQAQLQFGVDEGVSYQPISGGALVRSLPTNVTRLERMVQDADAFIGIYPLSVPATAVCSPQQLLQESRYFRLEMEIAMRAGKPALVFHDKRYKSSLVTPSRFYRSTFDAQEIESGISPSAPAFERTFHGFCDSVQAAMALEHVRGARAESSNVGVLLPPRGLDGGGYDTQERQALDAALSDSGFVPVPLHWPPVVDQQFFASTSELAFCVVDVGDQPELAAAVAFLHGRGVPALRLRYLRPGAAEQSILERTLYGGTSVGYPKDIVRWSSSDELVAGLTDRIQVIGLPPRLISTSAQAERYFAETAKRPMNLFVSYSGKDQELSKRIILALKERFQKVFDYRDGESIRPGEPWLQEIFEQLKGSAVAVPLVSTDYYASENCMHEARQIIARRDDKALHVFAVRLHQNIPQPPEWLQDGQFDRLFEVDQDVTALVRRIVDFAERKQAEKPATP
jgi:hypothetical protein